MVFFNNSICFPATDPATFINDGGPIFDGESVGYRASPIYLAITLPALLLAAQIFSQPDASPLIGIDSLIHSSDRGSQYCSSAPCTTNQLWHEDINEPKRKLLGQCADGKLLWHDQSGKLASPPLRRP